MGWLLGVVASGCVAEGPYLQEMVPPPELPPAMTCARVAERDTELPRWDIFMDLQDWDALHVDVYADVTVDALLCAGGSAFPITFELQGASTRGQRKKSFDLKLKSSVARQDSPFFHAQDTGGLPRVILKAMYRDATLVRETVAFDAWRAMGYDAPRSDYVNLRINGSDRGLYVMVEPVDETYLATRGLNPDGTLYKGVRKNGDRADFDPRRDTYAAFENKSAHTSGDWLDLEDLIDRLQHTSLTLEAFEQEIDPLFSLDAYMDRMLWVSLTQNTDAVAQNFFLHNLGDVDAPDWHVIPWDSNVCLGMIWNDHYVTAEPQRDALIDGGNYFSRRMLKVPELKARYIDRYREALDGVLGTDALIAAMDQHSARIAVDLERDNTIWQRPISGVDATDDLATYLMQRPDAMREALDNFDDREETGGDHDDDDEHGADAGMTDRD